MRPRQRRGSGLGGVLLALAVVWVAVQAAGSVPASGAGSTAAAPGGATAVAYARAQIGDTYVWGADGPDAWDCSGLVGGAWRKAGYGWPDMTAAGQYAYLRDRGRVVKRSQLKAGDLVFFGSPIHHVAMYVGHGRMVEAQQPGVPVHEVALRTSEWAGAARPGGGA
jgi:cell wall-associated NlpC family hydrolase